MWHIDTVVLVTHFIDAKNSVQLFSTLSYSYYLSELAKDLFFCRNHNVYYYFVAVILDVLKNLLNLTCHNNLFLINRRSK